MEMYTERYSKFGLFLAICFITLPFLFIFRTSLTMSTIHIFPNSNGQSGGNARQQSTTMDDTGSNKFSNYNNNTDARLLHGLLSPKFEEESCISRYQSHLYYKNRTYKPSTYLMSKLREYEFLHRRCGPMSKSYKSKETDDCKYLVWVSANGLGNRMMSLASVFLYAILTNRVLLVEFFPDMEGLFCEPFPNSTWILPDDFPYRNEMHNVKQLPIFSSLISNQQGNDTNIPPFLSLDLHHGIYGDPNLEVFHCVHSQDILNKVRSLAILTDQYLVPTMFLMSNYNKELTMMFPDNGAVFYHLSHYLFHPSNEVWGLITRFYDSYLAKADEIVGFQIRVFMKNVQHQTVLDQVLACAEQHNILPKLDQSRKRVSFSRKNQTLRSTSMAVLVTSLYPQYAEELRFKYWTRPTTSGEVVGVFQPSHDELQKQGDIQQNMKALAEMYLLSFSNVLVSSSYSTFGYVAQGLAGLKPWVLTKPYNENIPNPPCRRDISMDPCLHVAPKLDCKNNKFNISDLYPPMAHCVDETFGLKMAMD